MKHTHKKCLSCKKNKPLIMFGFSKSCKNGIHSKCKDCIKEIYYKYNRTKNGVVTKMYGSQIKSSKIRNHTMPTYTKKEFKEWLFSQKKFHILFDNWKRLDYQLDYIPSVDRKNDYIGYTMDNIQIMTWGENRSKGHFDMRHGINNKQSKAVLQYEMDGTFLNKYHSLIEAERQTGVSNGSIYFKNV